MSLPEWISLGVLIGIFGYIIDTQKTPQVFVGGMLLGVFGALYGYMLGNILTTIPILHSTPSPLFLSFLGGFFLLLLGKMSRKMVH